MKYDECNTKPLSDELFRFFTMRDAMNATVRSTKDDAGVLVCIRRSCGMHDSDFSVPRLRSKWVTWGLVDFSVVRAGAADGLHNLPGAVALRWHPWHSLRPFPVGECGRRPARR